MLARFTEFWTRMHKEMPDTYPMEMPPEDSGAWDEQYRAFCESYVETPDA